MIVVSLEEAKERMEELARLASSGESVRITQGKMPTLELRAVNGGNQVEGERVGGQWEGRFVVGPEFFEPMPKEWLDLFYNGPVFPEQNPDPPGGKRE